MLNENILIQMHEAVKRGYLITELAKAEIKNKRKWTQQDLHRASIECQVNNILRKDVDIEKLKLTNLELQQIKVQRDRLLKHLQNSINQIQKENTKKEIIRLWNRQDEIQQKIENLFKEVTV